MSHERPWVKFWVENWLTSKAVLLLKPSYRSAYFQLLCYLWIDRYCSLPDDRNTLLELSGIEKEFDGCMTEDQAEQVFSFVRPFFIKHPNKPGFITNKKLYEQFKIVNQISMSRSKAGILSGISRGSASNKCSTSVGTKLEQKRTILDLDLDERIKREEGAIAPFPTPVSNSKTSAHSKNNVPYRGKRIPTVIKLTYQADWFERLWKAYPNGNGKKVAVEAWQKLQPDEETWEKIRAAVKWQKQSPKWVEEDGKYVPMLATYLNNERWTDKEIPHSRPKANL